MRCSAVASFTVMSFTIGAPQELINSASGLLLVALQYLAYVLGFRMALGLTFGNAALVAIVSTLVTSVSIWYIAKMAFPAARASRSTRRAAQLLLAGDRC